MVLLVVAGVCAPLLCFALCYYMDWDWWGLEIFRNQREFFFFLGFPIEFPIFCMGILAVFPKGAIEPRLTAKGKKRISLLLIALSALLFYASFPTRNETLFLSSIGFVPLLLAVALVGWKALVNPLTVFTGKISYSIYLVHFFVIMAMQPVIEWIEEVTNIRLFGSILGFATAFMLVLFTAALISYATWRWIETPGIALGRRLIVRREA